ncbi:MAG: DUF397 domain-containing protein [Patescibacteria group bacterium]
MKTNNSSDAGALTFPVKDTDFVKSSYSHPGGIITRCVSVAVKPEGVAIRDTKDPSKATQFYTREEWNAFIKAAKAGEFDLK